MKSKQVSSLILAACMMAACTTVNPYTGERQVSNAAVGTGIGAAVGAVGGLLIGKKGDKRKAALIGAGIGALGGGSIGYYMDNQENELRQQLQSTGVSVTRNGNNIILNMPSNITFDVNKSNIKPNFHNVLNSVAIVLRKYQQTLVDVVGHTDSSGAADYNLQLSQARAFAVANQLNSRGVDGRRLQYNGAGENQPIASNNTKSGKALNRRVEIQLVPLTR